MMSAKLTNRNGKAVPVFPPADYRPFDNREIRRRRAEGEISLPLTMSKDYQAPMGTAGGYLKKHTEALVKDVGFEAACALAGKSKATLGRYYSTSPEHEDRFMPIDTVAALEEAARFPHVTAALADLRGVTIQYGGTREPRSGGVNADVVALSQRFASLMGEYNVAIEDGVISANEAKRLLRETNEIQQVLLEMRLHLEDETIG